MIFPTGKGTKVFIDPTQVESFWHDRAEACGLIIEGMTTRVFYKSGKECRYPDNDGELFELLVQWFLDHTTMGALARPDMDEELKGEA
jgi:hypothetical protein